MLPNTLTTEQLGLQMKTKLINNLVKPDNNGFKEAKDVWNKLELWK